MKVVRSCKISNQSLAYDLISRYTTYPDPASNGHGSRYAIDEVVEGRDAFACMQRLGVGHFPGAVEGSSVNSIEVRIAK